MEISSVRSVNCLRRHQFVNCGLRDVSLARRRVSLIKSYVTQAGDACRDPEKLIKTRECARI